MGKKQTIAKIETSGTGNLLKTGTYNEYNLNIFQPFLKYLQQGTDFARL